MKRSLLILVLLLLALALAGCASSNTYPDAEQSYQRDPMDVSTPVPTSYQDTLPEGYDPASEENDEMSDLVGVYYDAYGRQIYAGATPIPLKPINLPTATPRSPLTFSYTQITVNGITFEYPSGWSVETPDSDTIILRDPFVYDNYQAEMTIRYESVASGYTVKDTEKRVNEIISQFLQYNFTSRDIKKAAERTLLGKSGYYNNYSAVYYDGTKISGRVQVALLDGNRIITLHMTCPDGYNNSYMNVVKQFRDTAKLN